MAGEQLAARFSLRSQLWFRWIRQVRDFETATSHMQTVGGNLKKMKRRFLILFIIQFIFLVKSYGQEGKLYTIINADTIPVENSKIEVYIVVKNDTLSFNEKEYLKYPEIEQNGDVKCVLISVNGTQYEFFNKSKSNLPLAVLEAMGPFYQSLFADKRNMYVILKDKSDMFDDLPEGMITDEAQIEKQKSSGQLTLYYQQEVTMSTKK